MLYTPEELRFLSDLAHWIEGSIIGAAGSVALIQAFGYLNKSTYRYIWPALILLSGIFLPVFIIFNRGISQADIVLRLAITDPQQQQHFIISVLLIFSGIAEIAWRARFPQNTTLKLVWPVSFAIIGILFTIHTQHGTEEAVRRAILIHRYIAVALVSTGLLRTGDVFFGKRFPWLSYLWPITLLATAALLFSYRTP